MLTCIDRNNMHLSDNHSSNVFAYRKLFSHYGKDSPDLHFTFNSERIYLFYDSVYLMKSKSSSITKDSCFRLMILKNFMTEFVFRLAI